MPFQARILCSCWQCCDQDDNYRQSRASYPCRSFRAVSTFHFLGHLFSEFRLDRLNRLEGAPGSGIALHVG